MNNPHSKLPKSLVDDIKKSLKHDKGACKIPPLNYKKAEPKGCHCCAMAAQAELMFVMSDTPEMALYALKSVIIGAMRARDLYPEGVSFCEECAKACDKACEEFNAVIDEIRGEIN